MQFFCKNLIDRFASKNYMNFSLSLSTVGDLPNGFSLSLVLQVANIPVVNYVLLRQVHYVSLP